MTGEGSTLSMNKASLSWDLSLSSQQWSWGSRLHHWKLKHWWNHTVCVLKWKWGLKASPKPPPTTLSPNWWRRGCSWWPLPLSFLYSMVSLLSQEPFTKRKEAGEFGISGVVTGFLYCNYTNWYLMWAAFLDRCRLSHQPSRCATPSMCNI